MSMWDVQHILTLFGAFVEERVVSQGSTDSYGGFRTLHLCVWFSPSQELGVFEQVTAAGVPVFSVGRVWNQLFLHLIKRISTSARSHCYRNSRRVPVSSCISERMCERWRMFAAVAGTFEGGIKELRPGMCWLLFQASNS